MTTQPPSTRPPRGKPRTTQPAPDDETEEEDDQEKQSSETEDPYSPDPIRSTTEMGEVVYPTDTEKSYPSGKDGVYGFVVQLPSTDKPRFARPRGKEVISRSLWPSL